MKFIANKKYYIIGIFVLTLTIFNIVKPSYAASQTYTRTELQNMVVSTALSYLYNHDYSDYNQGGQHSSFSTRTFKESPEDVNRGNYFHIDCSSFVTSVYKFTFNYDFANYYTSFPLSGSGLYDYKLNDGSTYIQATSASNFRKIYLIHNRAIGASDFNSLASLKNNTGYSTNPYINNLDTNAGITVYYYELDTARKLTDSEVDSYFQRMKPGDIVTYSTSSSGHTMIYVGNAVESSSKGIIHSTGYEDYKFADGHVNKDISIRYTNIDTLRAILMYNNIQQISILRPINLLCKGETTCDSSASLSNLTMKVNNNTEARVEFNRLKIEQYQSLFKNNTTKVLTKYNNINNNDTIRYSIDLKNFKSFSFCNRFSGLLNTTKSSCEAQLKCIKLNASTGNYEDNKACSWIENTLSNIKTYTLTITANVPSNTSFVSCSDNCSKSGNVLTWSNITINPDKQKVITYDVRVNNSVSSNAYIKNSGTKITSNGKSLLLGDLNVQVETTLNSSFDTKVLQDTVNKFVQQVNNGKIVFNANASTNAYKFSLDNLSSTKEIGSLGFIKNIYYNAYGIKLDNYTVSTIRSTAFTKQTRSDDSYAYILNNDMDSNVKQMLPPGLYGGKLLYGNHPSLTVVSTDNGGYNINNKLINRQQYIDPQGVEIGDIAISYDDSTSYVYLCTNKDSNKKPIFMEFNSNGIVTYNESSTNIYRLTLGKNLMILQRPVRLYGTTVFLNYNGGTGNYNSFIAYETYKNLNKIEYSKTASVKFVTNKDNVVVNDKIVNLNGAGFYSNSNLTSKVTNTSSLVSSSPHYLYAKYEGSIVLPTPSYVDGYFFGGWYKDSALTQKVGNAGDTYVISKNETLYAKWDVIEYQISYNLNGGYATNPTYYDVETETFTIKEPTKEGYIFGGWTGSNGSTLQKTITIRKGTTGNLTYVAKWYKDFSLATISDIEDIRTYNGTYQTQNIIVKYNDEVLQRGIDYTIKYLNNKNVGTATVTITGIGNYIGSFSKTFTINKAKNPLSVKVVTKILKYTKVKKAKQVIKPITVTKWAGTVTYRKMSSSSKLKLNTKTGKITVKKGTKKGIYKVKVKIMASGNTNYTSTYGYRTITVKVK